MPTSCVACIVFVLEAAAENRSFAPMSLWKELWAEVGKSWGKRPQQQEQKKQALALIGYGLVIDRSRSLFQQSDDGGDDGGGDDGGGGLS